MRGEGCTGVLTNESGKRARYSKISKKKDYERESDIAPRNDQLPGS